MWHEARKQEKKIRGMLVDYKRRAERRREYYEKIKQDPTQFIQIHGRSCKIHLDPAVHYAAEAPGSMMPWRGDRESMIDRFDVRAHLDDIPPFNPNFSFVLTPEELWEERQSNYERYRILVQNEFLGVREEKFLNQIRLEELYGPVGNRAIEEEKKSLMPKKAAIGFNYDEIPVMDNSQITWPSATADEPEDSGEDSDSDIDLDLTVDVLSLTNEQQMEMNTSGVEYGLNKGDFMALISRDLEEAEALRVAKEHEDEKAMFSGRKSRKERRALKKKHLDKKLSPPSYAARASPTYSPHHRLLSHSKSKSTSPTCGTSQIKFITCFGEESEGGGSDVDGSSGVIIIPEPEKSARSGHHRRADRKIELSSTSSSSMRRNRNRHRTSSSSRDRSRSISGNRSSSRRHHPSRSSSRRRSRSRSRHEGSRYMSSHSNRRSESYNRKSYKISKMRSRSRSRSSDRRQRSQYSRRYRSSKSYSPLRSRSKSFRSRSRSFTKRREPQTSSKPDKKLTSTKQEDGKGASPPPHLPSPPRRRYYGRRAENSNSDADSCAEESGEPVSSNAINKGLTTATDQSSSSLFTPSSFGNDSSTDKVFSAGSKLTPKERLRKKMQALLKKQYKADKKLEKERAEKAEQERQDREDELREIAIKLRRREREKRHRLHGDDSESDDSHESRSSSVSSVSKSGRNRERTPTLEKEIDRLEERSRLDRGTYSRSHSDRADSREKGRDRGGDNYRPSERDRSIRSHERENGKPHRDHSYRDNKRFSGSRSRDVVHESNRNRSSRTQTVYSSSRSNIEDEGNRLSEEENRRIRLVDY